MSNPCELPLNAVIRSTDSLHALSVPHRVLYCDRDCDYALLFRMEGRYRRPRRHVLHELTDDWNAGRLIPFDLALPSVMRLPEKDIPPKVKATRDAWWARLEPLLGPDHLIVLFENFAESIKSFSLSLSIDRAFLYARVYRYFYYGCIPNAFLPQFELRGGAGKPRLQGTKKLGAPRKAVKLGHDELNVGKNVTEADKANIQDIMDSEWSAGDHKTWVDVHVALVDKHYCAKDPQTGKVRLSPYPTCSQFIYHAKRLPDYAELLRRRVTAKRFDREYRAIVGRSMAEAYGPKHRYQIDATIGDIYLTSMFDRSWIIGRPVIYLVSDVFSAKFVGLYIGLEGPSWEGARLALLNAFLPKNEYLKRLGLEDELAWNADGVCTNIMGDRAELLSNNALGLTTGLGVSIDIASGYRPDMKGIVERRFGLLNGVIHFMPGAVRKRIRERGEPHCAEDGVYNMLEFTRMIVRDLVRANEHQWCEDRRTPGMITAGIRPVPDALWDFGMEHLVGGTPTRTREEIYAHLLPQDDATVYEDGIHFNGLRYTSSIAMQQRWFEQARYNKCFKVRVRHNPEIPERIWLISSSDSQLRSEAHQAKLIDVYSRYTNLQMDEILDLHERESIDSIENDQANLAHKIKNRHLNRHDTEDAKAEYRKSVAEIGKSQRTKNIREQRGTEKQYNRGAQANYEREHFTHSKSSTDVPKTSDASSTSTRSVADSLILKMLQSEEAST
jgi:putative transposase